MRARGPGRPLGVVSGCCWARHDGIRSGTKSIRSPNGSVSAAYGRSRWYISLGWPHRYWQCFGSPLLLLPCRVRHDRTHDAMALARCNPTGSVWSAPAAIALWSSTLQGRMLMRRSSFTSPPGFNVDQRCYIRSRSFRAREGFFLALMY